MFYKFLYFLFGSFTGTIIFALYVEFSNKIGNIWLRTDINGFKTLNISSLFNLMISPFKIKELWKPIYWDINWPIFSSFFGILFLSFNSYYYNY